MTSEIKFKEDGARSVLEKRGGSVNSKPWPVVEVQKVCDLIVDCVNKTAPTVDHITPYRMIRTTNIKSGKIDLASCKHVEADIYERWTRRAKVKEGDVLLTREAPIGEVGYVNCDDTIFLGQRIMQYRANPRVLDSRYLYYSFLTPELRYQFGVHEGSGSVVSHIRVGDCYKFKIPLPSLNEQIVIANILGSLDDKIDLNRQMNSTLEHISQALFKNWFIDFEFPDENGNPYRSSGGRMVDSELGEIPEGWRIGSLGEFCEIIMGQSPPGKTYNEEKNGLPFHQGITDFGFRFPSQRVYCTEPKRFAEKEDVLLSVRAPVGSLNIAAQKYAIGRGLSALRLKKDHGGYLFYLMKATQSRWNIFESEGTVFGSIGKSDIHNFETIIPPQNMISKFNTLIRPVDERISLNEKQSLILSSIRDSLLPKLMSGKIRVQI